MPAKCLLNQEQKERLQKLVRVGECSRLKEHALILLLQNDGKTYEEIASFIGGKSSRHSFCRHALSVKPTPTMFHQENDFNFKK